MVMALRSRPSRSATSCWVSASTRPKVAPATSAKPTPAPMRPQCACAPRPDARPGHVQRQRQAEQDHRHRDQDGALRPLPVDGPDGRGRPQRVGVESQQRQAHRDARHRRIQAQALDADQQAISGMKRRCRGFNASGTRYSATTIATTAAVPRLRTATAVPTSTPWSSAMRAATWLPPNMQASSSSMAKARGLIGWARIGRGDYSPHAGARHAGAAGRRAS